METNLGAIFYPTGTEEKPIPFESLYLPWIWKEIYMDGIYTDIFNQKKDMVVIDIGANSGLVTKYMRDYAKIVYAIEPDPNHFAALKKNKEYNKWDNVEIFNAAVAESNGKMMLNTLDNNQTCNSLANDYGQGGNEVETIRLDAFMAANKIKEVDFVKCDVENYEDILLRCEGFTNVADKIKAIEVEFHNADWKLLVEHMIKLGFTARRYDSSAIIVLFTRA